MQTKSIVTNSIGDCTGLDGRGSVEGGNYAEAQGSFCV